MGYIKVAIDLLKSPPRCPECGKKMKPYATAGFFEAIEQTIEIVCCGNVKFVCLSKKKNDKYAKWQADKRKYDQELAQYQNSISGKVLGAIGAKNPPKPIPQAPAMIPCKNHYKLQVAGGEYNEKITKKRKKPTFDSNGRKNVGLI